MKNNIKTAMIIVVLIILCILSLNGIARADNEYAAVTTAKQDALHEAAEILRACGYSNDSEVIKALSNQWWKEKEDLDIVAKVIQNEADPRWCEWEHSVAVGVVVMNRVRSEYFPDTVKEVVNAPGQYLPAYTRNFEKTTRLAYLAAKDAIDGNHEVPVNAFWQDNKKQGCYVWKEFNLDTGWFKSTTYICCGVPNYA